MTLTDFIHARAGDVYPEPRTDGHDRITREMIPRVLAHKPDSPNLILDVGCGQGPALEVFRELGQSAMGIATGEEDIAECRRRGFDAAYGDQNELIFPDNWFDIVWARHVLEHSIAPLWTLYGFYRVLAPGGLLYVEVPAPDTACEHEGNANHYAVMGHRMWASLLRKAKFEVMEAANISITTEAGPDTYFYFIAKKQPTE